MCHWVSSLEALAEFRLRRPLLTGALQRARRSRRRWADLLHVESLSWHLAWFNQTREVRRIRHQGRDAIAQQTMRPNTRGARDWTGDGTDTSAELGGPLGNQQ